MRLPTVIKLNQKQKLLAEFAAILSICVVGLLMRIHNVTSYILYPDGYQNLIIAQNLTHSHTLLSSLGKNGMAYPSSLDLTRPLYPAAITLARTLLGLSFADAGHIVSLIAGTVAIPLAYCMVKVATGRSMPSLIGACLMATSFVAIVWSGYIMSEALSNVVMLLTLLALITVYKRQTLSQRSAIGLGLLLGLAFLTRYEYFLLIIPAVFLLLRAKNLRAVTGMVAVAYTTAIFFVSLFLRSRGFSTILHDFGPLVLVTTVGLMLIGLALLAPIRTRLIAINTNITARAVLATFVILMLFSFLGIISYGALYNFEAHDFVFASLAVIGFYVMLKSKTYHRLGLTLLLATFLLAVSYAKVNNTMWRYMMHLLPLLVVPAALAGEKIITWITACKFTHRLIAATVACLILLMQLVTSYNGLHTWNNDIWFDPGYEQLSAQKLVSHVDANDVIVSATPEPYYYFTQVSTVEATDVPPFIPAQTVSGKNELVIVQDAYLRKLYPQFSAFISENLGKYTVNSYNALGNLRFGYDISMNPSGVTIFKVSPKEYNQAIQNAAKHPEESK